MSDKGSHVKGWDITLYVSLKEYLNKFPIKYVANYPHKTKIKSRHVFKMIQFKFSCIYLHLYFQEIEYLRYNINSVPMYQLSLLYSFQIFSKNFFLTLPNGEKKRRRKGNKK